MRRKNIARYYFIKLDLRKCYSLVFQSEELGGIVDSSVLLEKYELNRNGIALFFKSKTELKRNGLKNTLNFCTLEINCEDGRMERRNFILCSNIVNAKKKIAEGY